jgi:hypothetical protein
MSAFILTSGQAFLGYAGFRLAARLDGFFCSDSA